MASLLDTAINKMKKDYGAAIADVDKAGVVTRIVSDSPNLNYILGGGIPKARVLTFLGPESGGKTVISNFIAGQIQKQNDYPNVVVFVDMEHTFDKKYGETVGLDTSKKKFIFVRPKHGEEGFEILRNLAETGEIGCVVWDSVAATPSSKSEGKAVGSATFGSTASVMADGLKQVNPILSRYGVTTIFINQIRAKIGGMPGFGPQENTKVGGFALPFYSSWIARVSGGDEVVDGKEVIGKAIKINNKKSKIGIPKRQTILDLNYSTGFNPDMEYVDFIINLGYVKKSGSWISSDELGIKVQGRTQLLNVLKEKPTLFDDLKQKINASFSQTTILDNPVGDDDEEDDKMDAIFQEIEEDE